jgi:hypothetical protein
MRPPLIRGGNINLSGRQVADLMASMRPPLIRGGNSIPPKLFGFQRSRCRIASDPTSLCQLNHQATAPVIQPSNFITT